jgi:Cellulose binding domain
LAKGAQLAVMLIVAVAPAACSSSHHDGDGGATDAREAAADEMTDVATEGAVDAGPADGDAASDATETGDATEIGDAPNSGDAAETGDAGDAGGAETHPATDGGGDGAPDGPAPCATCGLYAVFTPLGGGLVSANPGNFRFAFNFGIDIVNGSDQHVALSTVTYRYWFSDDASSWQWQCAANCGTAAQDMPIQAAPPPPHIGADSYLEVAFTGGSLDAFSDTGAIVQVLNAFTSFPIVAPELGNDYSFSPDPTQPDPRITIYVAGKLVWGVEP